MTIIELTPAEIYGLQMLALCNAGFAVLGVREMRKSTLPKERAMFAFGLAALVGVPVLLGLRVVLAHL